MSSRFTLPMRTRISDSRSPTRSETAPRTSPSAKCTRRVPESVTTRSTPPERDCTTRVTISGNEMRARSPASTARTGASPSDSMPTSSSSGPPASR